MSLIFLPHGNEGNVFTVVCLSIVPSHRTPLPPRPYSTGTTPPGTVAPWDCTPWDCSPLECTPWGHSLQDHTPSPRTVPPGTVLPQDRNPQDHTQPPEPQKRVVRILLEGFLVVNFLQILQCNKILISSTKSIVTILLKITH